MASITNILAELETLKLYNVQMREHKMMTL